jgi:hypothetical protein
LETAFELLDVVAAACEELGIPYAVGGSMASMTYGELRSTRDLDVILMLRPEDVPRLLARFPRPDYYHDEAAALEAVRSGGQFNIIDNERGLKVDVFSRAMPFRASRSRGHGAWAPPPAARRCSRRRRS